jgi:hypothetical protein
VVLCESSEASWSGYFSYTEANCTNGADVSSSTPVNAFRVDPQDDGSLDLYIASVYIDSTGYCKSCVQAANGSIANSAIESEGAHGNSVSGQTYTGGSVFSLITYIESWREMSSRVVRIWMIVGW